MTPSPPYETLQSLVFGGSMVATTTTATTNKIHNKFPTQQIKKEKNNMGGLQKHIRDKCQKTKITKKTKTKTNHNSEIGYTCFFLLLGFALRSTEAAVITLNITPYIRSTILILARSLLEYVLAKAALRNVLLLNLRHR